MKSLPKSVKAWFIIWLPLVMLSLVPVMGSYLKNISETSVQDLILPVALNVLVVTIIAAVTFRAFLRHRLTIFLTGVFLTVILTNSYETKLTGINNSVNALLPFTISPFVFSIVYLVVVVWLTYLVARWLSRLVRRSKWAHREFIPVITIIIGVIFISQLVPTVRNLAAAWPQFFYRPPQLTAAQPTAAQKANKPDIYYILLEDYTNQSVFQSQFNYDNSNMLQYLSANGFYNNPQADANYPYTVNSVASTFAANYLSDPVNKFSKSSNQTLIPYFQTVRFSPVVQELKSLGYSYHLLGDWYETSSYSPLSDSNYADVDQIIALNHTYSIDDFTDSQIQQNVFWSLINGGVKLGNYRLLGYNTQDDVSLVKSQLSRLKTLASQPAGGRFIFSQILVPHNYFYFNPDGSLSNNPAPSNVGKLIKQKYTDNVQYINAQIKPIIDEIMQKSGGKANIIFQSDEGPDPSMMNDTSYTNPITVAKDNTDVTKWSADELKMKYGVLASYYLPGVSADELAKGGGAVNVFRLLLNTNFGANLPYLPQCYYAYPQGTSQGFVYQDITKMLTGQANGNCPANGNFINPGPTTLLKTPKDSATTGKD
jgi:hypothetical protein